MKYWLKEDIVGPVSRRVYGLCGDQVEYVSDDGMQAVVKGKDLFHVRLDLLSDKPLTTDEPKVEDAKEESKPEPPPAPVKKSGGNRKKSSYPSKGKSDPQSTGLTLF